MGARRPESTWPELSTTRRTSTSWTTLCLQWMLQWPDSSMTSVFLSFSLSLITVIMSVSLQDPLSTLLSCPPPPLLSVICGILKDRSVVLVTHQLQFAQLADNILAIKDVRVGRQFCSSHWGSCVEEGAKF